MVNMLFSLSLAHTDLFPFILKAGQMQQHGSMLKTQRMQTQPHPLHHKKRFHSLYCETQHKCPVPGSQQHFLMPVVSRWWSCLSKGSVCWEATAGADAVWEGMWGWSFPPQPFAVWAAGQPSQGEPASGCTWHHSYFKIWSVFEGKWSGEATGILIGVRVSHSGETDLYSFLMAVL